MENAMKDLNMQRVIPLTPPVVDIAAPEDGLLKTADLDAPIPVKVRVWEAAEPGYYFQLILNGARTGDITTLTEKNKPGDFILTFLSERLLIENGSYRLGYVASSPDADSHIPSPEVELLVDRTPPGATLLAPMIFPNASFGDQLIGLLPGYAGMEPGDLIQTLCNGVPGPTHTVEPDELTLRPIEIAFERTYLQTLGADTVLIEYQVTDRAGNFSVASLPVLMTVKL
jgi:hypothetical protein